MRIKLEDLNVNKNKSTEISVLSDFKEMVEQKRKELIISNMNNSLAISYIELIFFIDKSGSVIGTEITMCEYLRKIINKYKNSNSNILVTLILFSDEDEILYYRCPIDEVDILYYIAMGGTSLYDSLFKNITNLMNSQIDINGVVSKTIVTIFTDGEDFSSKKYKEADVEKIVKYTKSLGWEYIFLSKGKLELLSFIGIEKDNFMGIEKDHIAVYDDFDALSECFDCIDKAIESFIESGTIDKKWKESLNSNVLRLTKKGD